MNKIQFNEWLLAIRKVSNPIHVIDNAKKYLGPDVIIEPSDKPTKKYKVYNPNTNKYIYFGSMLYEDYTKHRDINRKKNYLKRSSKIRGNWQNNPYSPNNLSRELLWK